MSLFGPDKKRVTRHEFDEHVKHRLFQHGISPEDRNKMMIAINAHIDESGDHAGLDEHELDHMMKSFRSKDHGIPDKHLDILESELRKKL